MEAFTEFRFVPPITGKETRRQRDLERAAQRAHSATIAHHRRRTRSPSVIVFSASHATTAKKKRIDLAEKDATNEQQQLPAISLWQGHTDPFNSLGLEVTPDLLDIIAFARDCYLPSQWIPSWLRQTPEAELPSSALVRHRALPGSVGVLRSLDYVFAYPETIPAWITSLIPCMIDLLPPANRSRYELLLLQYRTHSLQHLRKAIKPLQNGDDKRLPAFSLILQIVYLFRSDCTLKELVAAQAHAVILPWIEKADDLDQKMTVHLLTVAMFHDTDMACKAMRHTLLDFKHWLANMLRDFWAGTENLIEPSAKEAVEGLNVCILNDSGPVLAAMTRLRQCLRMRDDQGALGMHPPDQHEAAHRVWAWAATTTMHDIGLLINEALDVVKQVEDKPEQWKYAEGSAKDPPTGSKRLDLYLHAAMTLTALYNVRKYLHEGNCNGIDQRDAPLIMIELQHVLLNNLEQDTRFTEHSHNESELLFWIFFTGAWHAQKMEARATRDEHGLTRSDFSVPAFWESTLPSEASTPSRPSSPTDNSEVFDAGFFNKNLSCLASRLCQTSWPTARDMLKLRFAFSDEVARPHPSIWYEEIIERFSGERLSETAD